MAHTTVSSTGLPSPKVSQSETTATPEIRVLDVAEARQHQLALAEVLVDAVQGGASVSFMLPFTNADAMAFFDKVITGIENRERLLFTAWLGDSLVGTVQLVTALPPNQPHRAEVAKLLVHRKARGLGIGQLLMQHLEQHARTLGKSLLVLDTVTGDTAERLYERLGWTRAGVIPEYALYPDGRPCSTTIFYKLLDVLNPFGPVLPQQSR
ncbi:MAG: GNAT family N-acetyltransferase [Bryobacteraceae bacterium]|nr:GNAT family N-acetyltransferase [Bryobacteraceae bacterium]